MKRIRYMWVLSVLLVLFAQNLLAQDAFTPALQQEVINRYRQLAHKEISESAYVQIEKRKYLQHQAIVSGKGGAFDGCNRTLNTNCGNGDFENGLVQNEWGAASGSLDGNDIGDPFNPAFMTEGFSTNTSINSNVSHQTIVNGGGLDPTTNIIPLVAPGGSTQALRIGNSQPGFGTELISKRITVTAAQTIFSFWYAVVLEEPGPSAIQHFDEELGAFKVRVFECSGNTAGTEITGVVNLGNNSNQIIADSQDPFLESIPGTGDNRIVFRRWRCAQINLSGHIGETVLVTFITEDCGHGGHFGYAYIDNFCGNCTGANTISLHSAPPCAAGRICFNYAIPDVNGKTGSVQISLQLYQNGVPVGAPLQSPDLTSGSQFCFDVDPATYPGLNLSLPGYDFVATGSFTVSGFTDVVIVGNPPTGQSTGQNNDVLISCIPQCCPGRNAIRNPGFELGNVFFSTAYNYTGIIAPNSVGVGRYSLLNSAEALIVSPTWDVNCASNGKHLVINGATGGPGLKIAWNQTVTVTHGKTYKFCVDMKNLPQCAFDVKPRITVRFSVPGYNINGTVIDVPAGNCNWQQLSQVITMPAGFGNFPMSITIYLDETPTGDGNDIAIDNLTLVEIPQTPINEVFFNVNYFNVTANTYNIEATPVTPLGDGCGFYWEVAEVDVDHNVIPGTAVYNPSQWWTNPPYTFTGYNGTSVLSGTNPGVFETDKIYQIVYGRWCECSGWNSLAVIIDPYRSEIVNGPATVFPNTAYSLSATQIATIVNSSPIKVHELKNPAPYQKTITSPVSTSAIAETVINLYPNPVTDKLKVTLPPQLAITKLVLLSSHGQSLETFNVTRSVNPFTIETLKYPAGTYYLLAYDSQGKMKFRKSFVKLRK